MEELIFVLLGAILVTYGWYWGGVTESRTTGVATGVPALILAGVVIFDTPPVEVAAVAGVGAVFGVLVALSALWETAADRSLGLFALFAALVTILTIAAISNATEQFETNSLAYVGLAVAWGLVFVSAALTPENRPFRNLVGWILLGAGALVAFMAYAPALEITFN